MNRSRHLGDQRRRCPRIVPIAGDPTVETAALDHLHRVERPPVLFAHVVDANNVRVSQTGCVLDLFAEPADGGRPSQPAGRQLFQGNHQVRPDRPGPVDDPHRAAPDFSKQFVLAQMARPTGLAWCPVIDGSVRVGP
jgi:hypothetical protein